MKKINLILSLIVLFAAFSMPAQGITQKPIDIQPPPTPQFDNLISVEDDATGSFLVFSPISGEYRFFRCGDNREMKGIGKVKLDGCSIVLEDVQKSHRVLASVDQCAQQAKAAVEQFVIWGTSDSTPMKEYLADKDMRDNTMDCLPKKKE